MIQFDPTSLINLNFFVLNRHLFIFINLNFLFKYFVRGLLHLYFLFLHPNFIFLIIKLFNLYLIIIYLINQFN